jgi:hypothetical protein
MFGGWSLARGGGRPAEARRRTGARQKLLAATTKFVGVEVTAATNARDARHPSCRGSRDCSDIGYSRGFSHATGSAVSRLGSYGDYPLCCAPIRACMRIAA